MEWPCPHFLAKKRPMTDSYAVIGNPISHSKSPDLHAAFAIQCGQNMQYRAILSPLDRFADVVHDFRASGGRGMNVTLPFKLEAFALADELTERAWLAQAVNTLLFKDGRIVGDNTDGVGLVLDLKENLRAQLGGKRILILGAGGAARGVLRPLLNENPALLAIANNTPSKAIALKDQVAHHDTITAGGFSDFAGVQFDVVINATSASLNGNILSLPDGIWANNALAYDMTYGDRTTPFMEAASAGGAVRTADGFGMLAGQAAESFYIWRGMRPDIVPVIKAIRAAWK